MDDKNIDESLRGVFRQLANALPYNPYVEECTIYTFAVSAVYSMYRAHQLNYKKLHAAQVNVYVQTISLIEQMGIYCTGIEVLVDRPLAWRSCP